MNLESLALHHAIDQFNAAYAAALDDARFDDWPGFFTEEGHYTVQARENHARGLPLALMALESRGMLKDRISALREANVYERHTYRHILGQPAVDDEAADGSIRSETPFLVVRIMRDGQSDVYATGRYLDVYRMAGDTPKLAERVVVCDSSRIDTLLALPL